ncbi:MDR family MFS transporter [Streptomyces fuscichromogenes]|uniref:MFS transporter n=1 Tax=Streptomyces fuscichromogenes TaxID=1324013 RepID=A0A917XK75_9ACTN|nr:MDR family MFS transporter [Streptomyces fuscichromogenes]GGN33654.1 MFS transporter [Streptomyces fuscichromogenes]
MADRPPEQTPEAAPAALTHRQILYIVSGLLMGIFLIAMEQTVVATSIRVIADDFGGYSQQAWVTTAYLVTSTIVTPLYGKLSDIFGRKPSYLFAVTVFMLGSTACACATSMYELAAFRAVQGIGAGGLSVLAFTILGEIVAPRERARYQGYFLAVFTGSSVIGPLIGGVLSDSHTIAGITGWRWAFLINVPLGLVALLVVYRVLNIRHARREGVRIDWIGSAALTVALTPMLVVAQFGQEWGWGSVRSVACFAVFGVGALLFLWVEKRMGQSALLPLRVFRNTRFSQGAVLAFVLGVLILAPFSLVPQYFQVVLGAGPTRAGALLLPMIAGTIAGALTSGQIISRTGTYRVHSIASAILTVVSMFLLYVLSGTESLPALLPVTFAFGLGIGCFSQPITLVMQNILPARELGISTAAATFFRQIGGTAGVAVLLSVWFALTPSAITHHVSSALRDTAYRQDVALAARHTPDHTARQLVTALNSGDTGAAQDVVHNTSALQTLPRSVSYPLRQAFADSMSTVFLITSAIAVVGLVVLVLWKPVTLRAKAGAQEAAKERAASKG